MHRQQLSSWIAAHNFGDWTSGVFSSDLELHLYELLLFPCGSVQLSFREAGSWSCSYEYTGAVCSPLQMRWPSILKSKGFSAPSQEGARMYLWPSCQQSWWWERCPFPCEYWELLLTSAWVVNEVVCSRVKISEGTAQRCQSYRWDLKAGL